MAQLRRTVIIFAANKRSQPRLSVGLSDFATDGKQSKGSFPPRLFDRMVGKLKTVESSLSKEQNT